MLPSLEVVQYARTSGAMRLGKSRGGAAFLLINNNTAKKERKGRVTNRILASVL
jgi:hypothetical protein